LKNPDYPLDVDDSLITGGVIDSYSLVNIAVFVESEFGVKIPDTDLNLDNMDTIGRMTARILKEMRSDDPV
jgi:acyl carrier protein